MQVGTAQTKAIYNIYTVYTQFLPKIDIPPKQTPKGKDLGTCILTTVYRHLQENTDSGKGIGTITRVYWQWYTDTDSGKGIGTITRVYWQWYTDVGCRSKWKTR
jgi:hypothetical protein